MPQTANTPYHKQNATFPLKSGHRGWYLASKIRRYTGAVYHFLRTSKGGLYGDPEYGTTFYTRRAQTVSDTHVEIWRVELGSGFAAYLPDLLFHNIEVSMDGANETLTVKVTWSVRGATTALHGKLAGNKQTTVLI